jgi:hypothetical protein
MCCGLETKHLLCQAAVGAALREVLCLGRGKGLGWHLFDGMGGRNKLSGRMSQNTRPTKSFRMELDDNRTRTCKRFCLNGASIRQHTSKQRPFASQMRGSLTRMAVCSTAVTIYCIAAAAVQLLLRLQL